MQFHVLSFLLILTCLYVTLAQGSYDDCCLQYAKNVRKGVQKMVVDYKWQIPDGGCNIPAIVFTLKRGRVFCADPRERWATDLTRRLDKKRDRKHHRRGPKRD